MKGFRTIGFNMVVAMLVAPALRWLVAHGVDLGGYTAEQLTMELLVNGNVLLRCVTDSPVGKTAAKDLQALGPALYEQFMREFKARNASRHPTEEIRP